MLHQDREAHRGAARQAEDQLEALRQELSSRAERIGELEMALVAAEGQRGALEELRAEEESLRARLLADGQVLDYPGGRSLR